MLATRTLQAAPSAPEFDRALISRYDINGPRYTVSDRAAFPRSARPIPRRRAHLQRGSDSAPAVAVRACRSPEPVLLLRLHAHHHPRRRAAAYVDRLIREAALPRRCSTATAKSSATSAAARTCSTRRAWSASCRRSTATSTFRARRAVNSASRSIALGRRPTSRASRASASTASLGIRFRSRRAARGQPHRASPRRAPCSTPHARLPLDQRRPSDLPLQTRSASPRPDEVVSMQPRRIVTYAYAHLPDASRRSAASPVTNCPTPPPARPARTGGRAPAAGYIYIGMDHFARADDDLASPGPTAACSAASGAIYPRAPT